MNEDNTQVVFEVDFQKIMRERSNYGVIRLYGVNGFYSVYVKETNNE